MKNQSNMTEGPTAFENFQSAMKTILKAKNEPKREKPVSPKEKWTA